MTTHDTGMNCTGATPGEASRRPVTGRCVPAAPAQLDEREVRRQLMLSHHLSEALGDAVSPTLVEWATIHTALDVACGAGGWVLDLACAHPHLQVTGIDASTRCIATAQRLAHEGGFSNVRFLAQDPRKIQEVSHPLPGAPFDLIRLAFLAPTLLSMDCSSWLCTLSRLCRPGGTVCWTETEFPITNSPAFEQLIMLICHALDLAECRRTPLSMSALVGIGDVKRHDAREARSRVGCRLGIMPLLGSWFHEAGFQHVQQVLTAIEVSSGTEAHACFLLQVGAFTRQIAPFLLTQRVVTRDAYARLCVQLEAEVQHETFCGLCSLLTVLAQKPGAGKAACQ